MIRAALLMFIAAPGSFALMLLVLRSLVRRVRSEREADADEERRIRIMSEYAVPDFAVEECRVYPSPERPITVSGPAIKKDFRGFREEITR